MEWLFLIAALFDGPFRFALGLLSLLPLALLALAVASWLARRRPTIAARCRPWLPWICLLALIFAIAMDTWRPIRSLQDTRMLSRLGYLDKKQAHAEIDRHYTVGGLVLRGAIHYGPLSVLLFAWLGLRVGRRPGQVAKPNKREGPETQARG